jgi:hypothetical protein
MEIRRGVFDTKYGERELDFFLSDPLDQTIEAGHISKIYNPKFI